MFCKTKLIRYMKIHSSHSIQATIHEHISYFHFFSKADPCFRTTFRVIVSVWHILKFSPCVERLKRDVNVRLLCSILRSKLIFSERGLLISHIYHKSYVLCGIINYNNNLHCVIEFHKIHYLAYIVFKCVCILQNKIKKVYFMLSRYELGKWLKDLREKDIVRFNIEDCITLVNGNYYLLW